MANKKTLLRKVFERNGDGDLSQQASLPLRSRHQPHQLRIARVTVVRG